MQKFVTVITQGTIAHDADEVLLFFYGPQGGKRAIESLTPATAHALGHDLIDAAEAIAIGEGS